MSTESSYSQPTRVHFDDDEQRYPWLAILLDAYLVIDQGVRDAILREQRQGRNLACAKGCSNCCTTHQDIPVYPLELMGISWYIIEKMPADLRPRVQQRLQQVATLPGCPFLLNHSCSIHPLRPIACRQFNVLDRPCAEGEDAYHTRKGDVMMPIKRYSEQAFDIMLPFYGIRHKVERRQAIKQGRLHALARPLRDCQWQNLPQRMQDFDEKEK